MKYTTKIKDKCANMLYTYRDIIQYGCYSGSKSYYYDSSIRRIGSIIDNIDETSSK